MRPRLPGPSAHRRTRRAGPRRPHPRCFQAWGRATPVIYASDLAGAGAKERLVRRLLASLPGQETGDAGQSAPGMVSLELTALGQPRLFLGGQPGPGGIVFSGRRSHLRRLDVHRPGGSGRGDAGGV